MEIKEVWSYKYVESLGNTGFTFSRAVLYEVTTIQSDTVRVPAACNCSACSFALLGSTA